MLLSHSAWSVVLTALCTPAVNAKGCSGAGAVAETGTGSVADCPGLGGSRVPNADSEMMTPAMTARVDRGWLSVTCLHRIEGMRNMRRKPGRPDCRSCSCSPGAFTISSSPAMCLGIAGPGKRMNARLGCKLVYWRLELPQKRGPCLNAADQGIRYGTNVAVLLLRSCV